MGWLSSKKKEKPVQYEEGCVKCGHIDFDYSSYHSEFSCKSCGWASVARPRGKFNIVSKDNVPIPENLPKQVQPELHISQEPKKVDQTTCEEIDRILKAYGKTLQNDSPDLGCVADEIKLPYSKDKIKAAIILTLKNTDDGNVKELLKAGYLQLANWQAGVGNENIGADVSVLSSDMDIREKARVFSEQVGLGKEWQEKSNQERQSLQAELGKLGLWRSV
ncbi:hypothetical protein [Desulforhopalus sp. 52FAK]